MKIYYFLLLAVSLTLYSCQPDEIELPTEQLVVFEISRINHAWGLQHEGMFIQPSGERFASENAVNYRFPDTAGIISAADLKFNLQLADSTLTVVDNKKLARMINRIEEAVTGTLSRENVGNDFGAYAAYTYQLLENGDYQRTKLSACGDFNEISDNKQAKKIASWLMEMGEYRVCF